MMWKWDNKCKNFHLTKEYIRNMVLSEINYYKLNKSVNYECILCGIF